MAEGPSSKWSWLWEIFGLDPSVDYAADQLTETERQRQEWQHRQDKRLAMPPNTDPIGTQQISQVPVTNPSPAETFVGRVLAIVGGCIFGCPGRRYGGWPCHEGRVARLDFDSCLIHRLLGCRRFFAVRRDNLA